MLFKACVAEGLATFALCFIGGGAILTHTVLGPEGGVGLLGIAVAHGLALSIAVTATMKISGAHVNPAVTIAIMLTGRIGAGRAVAYILAQLLGGLVAGGLLSGVVFKNVVNSDGELVVAVAGNGTPAVGDALKSAAVLDAEVGAPESAPALPAGSGPFSGANIRAFIIEALITFWLVFAIFGTAVDPRAPNVGGFGIGLAVGAAILVAGPLTGAAMNPARVMGTGLFVAGTEFWDQLWLYWAGPVLGATAGAFVYDALVMDRSPKA